MTVTQPENRVPELRTAIDTAITSGDTATARALLAQLWAEKPGPALANYIIGRYDRLGEANQPQASARFAILRSYTLEPVVPVLRAAGLISGIRIEAQVGDFNTYAQDIFNPASNLYSFNPTVALLAVQTRDIAPELWDRFADLNAADVPAVVDRVVGEFRNLIRTFRDRSSAYLIVHTLEQPPVPSAGIFDLQHGNGQAEAIQQINKAVGEIARSTSGVSMLDYDGLIARCGRDNWYDERKWLTMRMPIRAEWLNRLAQEWLRFLHPMTGRVSKALVLDLDNTLWGGVIGEDGRDGILLGGEHGGAAFQALQRAIMDVRQRGILLAICSKNNMADAMDVLENHPGMLLRPGDFAAVRINWENKAENLRSIAAELNIGIDSLAFMDDNPAECQLVRSQLPDVTVIELPKDPSTYAALLRSNPMFERLSLSAEDRERGRYYAEQRQRTELEETSGSVEDFLMSLNTQVDIASVTAQTTPRTAQLTQKTNQFNLTTRRYSEQQIAQMATDPEWQVLTAHARDRFGDHGQIGVMLLKRGEEAWEIDTMLLSCRVIGRGVEDAMLAAAADMARSAGAKAITGQFIPTKKNAPASEFYSSNGFDVIAQEETTTTWSRDLAQEFATPAWITSNLQEEKV